MLVVILLNKFLLGENIYELGIMVIVGVLVGLIIGILFLKLVNDKFYGIFKDFVLIIFVILVVVVYELFIKLGGSGYMFCFIVGIIIGNKKNFKIWLS